MEILTLQPNQEDAGTRIDAWLAANLEDVTRSGAQRLLEEGKVTKDGKALAKNYKLTGRETLEVSCRIPSRWMWCPRTSRWISCLKTAM